MKEDLPYHWHVCPECNKETADKKYPHESVGDEAPFWCEHCEKRVTGEIGRLIEV